MLLQFLNNLINLLICFIQVLFRLDPNYEIVYETLTVEIFTCGKFAII